MIPLVFCANTEEKNGTTGVSGESNSTHPARQTAHIPMPNVKAQGAPRAALHCSAGLGINLVQRTPSPRHYDRHTHQERSKRSVCCSKVKKPIDLEGPMPTILEIK